MQFIWKKSFLVICRILGLFVNKKYFLLNRENLLQLIQIVLYKNQEFFSELFSAFLKFRLNFWIFWNKRWSSQRMFFEISRLRRTWLDKYLKSPVSEDPLISDRETVSNNGEIWRAAPFPYLLITVKKIELERVSLSDMPNLRTVS